MPAKPSTIYLSVDLFLNGKHKIKPTYNTYNSNPLHPSNIKILNPPSIDSDEVNAS
jgi:hypothetical protein